MRFNRQHIWNFFVKGHKHALHALYSAKSQTFEVNLGKANFNKSGITFDNIGCVLPVTLTDEVSGIKATVDFDQDQNKFVFDINGTPNENYPFLDSSFSLEDTEVKIIDAKISMNDTVVSEGGKEWLDASLQQAIYTKIEEEEPIKSFKVEEVMQTSTPVLNEMLGCVAMQEDIPEEGLKELIFYWWSNVSEPVDSSVMESLQQKCQHLTTLKLSQMFTLPGKLKMQLA